jgi:hypothetical protein
MNIKKLIKEYEQELEELLYDLDGYGYTRKQTLEELKKGFDTNITEETYFKWRDLNTRIKLLKKLQ